MKSFKNHISLVIALVSILFSLQVFTIVDRSIEAYKENLAKNYSLVVVSQKTLQTQELLNTIKELSTIEVLSPDNIIKKLNTGISRKNMELLKVTLPKFYKLRLKKYPTPSELEKIKSRLLDYPFITKVETFSNTHDTTYKLLLLFKNVILVLAISILLVTLLLIFKELRIWQFKHNERMNIMGLFGAPTWLRSAVLFRLSIVDALIAFGISFMIFSYFASSAWVHEQFRNIGISVVVFDRVYDSLIMLGVSIIVSILLASFIVLGHKEEV